MTHTLEAVLHDGTAIPVSVHGSGRSVLLPVRAEPYPPPDAETMRKWGADPDLGPSLIAGLARGYRIIAADYEGHRMAHPAPDTLTPANVAADLLAIANVAEADSFAYYGYSWLALAGLQLAIRTDRLWALAMGGYPPLDGPYQSMLYVTRSAHRMSAEAAAQSQVPDVGHSDDGDTTTTGAAALDLADIEPGDWDAVPVQTSEAQTRQFVTLYEALQDFDDSKAALPPGLPHLAFAGAADRIDYGAAWGNVLVSIGEPLAAHQQELTAAGWEVLVLPGLDHIGAVNSNVVLPLLQDWLRGVPS
ncbi:alpha/beta fold hydrolase [Arthrobacter sp. ISL-72]|uniref:alpha/beta fold hydrolase n=1 Tax=Arthrobacter sp. ISL-72 TaxID=2819114 RepID=UPI001BE714A7|nr:alpha/beta hydrolase [Arthrobacter sp. ISL-72]MBT2596165.1 alpha/beta hydrolase [Arthrobacter sp. ISL-72]